MPSIQHTKQDMAEGYIFLSHLYHFMINTVLTWENVLVIFFLQPVFFLGNKSRQIERYDALLETIHLRVIFCKWISRV